MPSSRRGSPRRRSSSPSLRATSKRRSLRCRATWMRRAGRRPTGGGVVTRCDRPGCDGEVSRRLLRRGRPSAGRGPVHVLRPVRGPAAVVADAGGASLRPAPARLPDGCSVLALPGRWRRPVRRSRRPRSARAAWPTGSAAHGRRLRSPGAAFTAEHVHGHEGTSTVRRVWRRDEHRRRLDRTFQFRREPGQPRCRSGGHALGARTRPAGRGPGGSPGDRAQAILRRVQPPRGAGPRPAAGPDRGLLPPLRGALFLHPQAVVG